MELYQKIRAYRLAHGITQTFVAEETNMSVKTLNAIEKGRQRLLAETFEKICVHGLKVSPKIFFDDDVLESKKHIQNLPSDMRRTG